MFSFYESPSNAITPLSFVLYIVRSSLKLVPFLILKSYYVTGTVISLREGGDYNLSFYSLNLFWFFFLFLLSYAGGGDSGLITSTLKLL